MTSSHTLVQTMLCHCSLGLFNVESAALLDVDGVGDSVDGSGVGALEYSVSHLIYRS